MLLFCTLVRCVLCVHNKQGKFSLFSRSCLIIKGSGWRLRHTHIFFGSFGCTNFSYHFDRVSLSKLTSCNLAKVTWTVFQYCKGHQVSRPPPSCSCSSFVRCLQDAGGNTRILTSLFPESSVNHQSICQPSLCVVHDIPTSSGTRGSWPCRHGASRAAKAHSRPRAKNNNHWSNEGTNYYWCRNATVRGWAHLGHKMFSVIGHSGVRMTWGHQWPSYSTETVITPLVLRAV